MQFKIFGGGMKAQWDEVGERVLLDDNTDGGWSADHVPVFWS